MRPRLIMDLDVRSGMSSLASSPTCCSPASVTSSAAPTLEVQFTRCRIQSNGAERDSFAIQDLTSHIFCQQYENVEDHYRLENRLGNGAMGVVRRCIEKSSGRQWACKTISKSLLTSQEHVESLIDEVEIQSAVGGHGAIADLHDVLEDDKNVYLVMELCEGGELFDSIIRHKRYPEADAARVIRAVISAVHYMHSNGIVHRDLKPENVVLLTTTSRTKVRVVDFGQAARCQRGERLTKFVGSAFYMSPETLCGNYGSETDIWSTGVMLYALLCGSPPFYAEDKEAIFSLVLAGEVDLSWGPWNHISDDAKDLVLRMLTRDPYNRITPSQIKRHPWILRHCAPKANHLHSSPPSPVSVLDQIPICNVRHKKESPSASESRSF